MVRGTRRGDATGDGGEMKVCRRMGLRSETQLQGRSAVCVPSLPASSLPYQLRISSAPHRPNVLGTVGRSRGV